MIDVISGGRLIAGMVVGGGPEYYSFSVNPTHARERFREAHDLIKKASKDKKISEDEEKRSLDEIQKLTDEEIKKMEEMAKKKEVEVMQV